MNRTYGWHIAETNIFWNEIAHCNHVVQIYDNERSFLDLLETYVVGGFKNGECVLVIATRQHLNALNDRLKREDYNLFDLTINDRYIPLEVDETMAKFMINGWPDENLFQYVMNKLTSRAVQKQQKVRAFGEMVAVLWSQGHVGATIELENLWNRYCAKHSLSLFCAYPKSDFQSHDVSLSTICATHAKVIDGVGDSTIIYRNMA